MLGQNRERKGVEGTLLVASHCYLSCVRTSRAWQIGWQSRRHSQVTIGGHRLCSQTGLKYTCFSKEHHLAFIQKHKDWSKEADAIKPNQTCSLNAPVSRIVLSWLPVPDTGCTVGMGDLLASRICFLSAFPEL